MNKESFSELCEECFGKRWTTDAARALGYTSRQIHRMASGEVPIKPGVAACLFVIAKQKIDRLTKIIDGQDVESLLIGKNKRGKS